MTIEARIKALAKKMSTQLRIRGEGLADVAEKAGRKLPRRVRADVDVLTEAETMLANPKLSRLVDEKRLRKAERRLTHFLDKQDPGAERRAEILDTVAKIAFVFVVIVLSVFFFLLWRGDLT